MLSTQENELITRCGRGTPMGQVMRQYWIPAALSAEFPVNDCDPVRILLLGERLIGFRDSAGNVGLLSNACPHRGASLFYGRNEDYGIRCVYHGWKFNIHGQCIDMPNEPVDSDFKYKVRARAYPCIEKAGIVWAYLGPRADPPPLPGFFALDEENPEPPRVTLRECNWLQALEGDIDTSHTGFLHLGHADPDDAPRGSFIRYTIADRAPRYKVVNTDFGTIYGAYRPADDAGHLYWRIANFMFPFYTMTPTGLLGSKTQLHAWVPMDDQHVLFWEIGRFARSDGPADQKVRFDATPPEVAPNDSTDWYGRFRTLRNARNDYGIDRRRQRAGGSFTGIDGVQTEDQAITESMGGILDRTEEHLGSSDVMVIRVRRRLIAAAKAMASGAVTPPAVDAPVAYRQRSGGIVLGREDDWLEATHELRTSDVVHVPDGGASGGGA